MNSPLSNIQDKISQYGSEVDAYDDSILKKTLQADEFRSKAAEPKKTSLQDALISSLIQVVPGLIGYAASGKAGGALGLKGGLAGGQIYNKILDDEFASNQQQNLMTASKLDKEVSGLTSARDKLEGRQHGLGDWLAKNQLTSSQKNARTGDITSSNRQLAGAFSKFLSKGDDEEAVDVAEETTEATAGSATSEEISNAQKIIQEFESSGAGMEALLTNTDQAKKVLDAVKKIQSYNTSELGDTQKEQSIAEKAPEIASLSRPVFWGGGIAIPKAGALNVETAAEGRELASGFRRVFEAMDSISDYVENNSAISRVLSDEVKGRLQDERKGLAKTVLEIEKLGSVDAPKAQAYFNQIMNDLPAFGSLWPEINSTINVFEPSLRTKHKSQVERRLREIKSRLEGIGFEVFDAQEIESRGGYQVGKRKDGSYDLLFQPNPEMKPVVIDNASDPSKFQGM